VFYFILSARSNVHAKFRFATLCIKKALHKREPLGGVTATTIHNTLYGSRNAFGAAIRLLVFEAAKTVASVVALSV